MNDLAIFKYKLWTKFDKTDQNKIKNTENFLNWTFCEGISSSIYNWNHKSMEKQF